MRNFWSIPTLRRAERSANVYDKPYHQNPKSYSAAFPQQLPGFDESLD
jgi:hypothetical protein